MQKLFRAVVLALPFSVSVANAQSDTSVFVDISGGQKLICALDTEGGLTCNQSADALRVTEPDDLPRFSDVVAGSVHGCGLSLEGKAICWGDNDFGQLDAPTQTLFTSLSAGFFHTCGITMDSAIECWGLNNDGQTSLSGNPFFDVTITEPNAYIALDLTETTTCALDTNGNIPCWGNGADSFRPQSTATGAPADVEVVGFAVDKRFPFARRCGLLVDGTIDCVANNFAFDGLYTDIAGFSGIMCGLTLEGQLDCKASVGDNQTLSPGIAAQISAINEGEPLTSINGDTRLCGITVSGAARCVTPFVSEFFPITTPGDPIPLLQAPQNLRAAIYSDSAVELLWEEGSSSAFRVGGAEIYRDGELLDTTMQLSSYLDTTLEANRTYEYQVRYVSPAGLPGDFSTLLRVNTTAGSSEPSASGYTPPQRPNEPADLTALVYGPDLLELQWSRVLFSQVGYEIRRDGEYVGYTSGISFVDREFDANTHPVYEVLAVNNDGDILGVSLIKVNGPQATQ